MSNNIYKRLILTTFGFHEIRDIDILLDRILYETRKFLNADAGSIYTIEDDSLIIKYVQNDSLKEKSIKYKFIKLPLDNSSIAGYCAKNDKTLNIEDVYKIPKFYPFTFKKEIDQNTGYRTKSMLVTPLHSLDGKVIGIIQIINKYDERGNIIPFNHIDEKIIIKYFSTQASYAIEKAIQTRNMIMKMIKMAQLRDPSETGAHAYRVGTYSSELYNIWAKKNGINEDNILKNMDVLKLAAVLHDVGKVAIPDYILKKPGKLTENEYNIMKLHTVFGAQLFIDNKEKFELACKEISLNHHERWDGKGYPGHINLKNPLPQDVGKYPKKGKEIPLFGRIVAIADVFDALMSKRSYKEPYSFEKVVSIIKENAGKQFDPELVDCFLEIKHIFKDIHNYFNDV